MRAARRAFTLLEVLVALAVAAAVLTALFGVFLRSRSVWLDVRDRSAAQRRVQTVLASMDSELFSASRASVNVTVGADGDATLSFSGQVRGFPGERTVRYYVARSGGGNTLRKYVGGYASSAVDRAMLGGVERFAVEETDTDVTVTLRVGGAAPCERKIRAEPMVNAVVPFTGDAP